MSQLSDIKKKYYDFIYHLSKEDKEALKNKKLYNLCTEYIVALEIENKQLKLKNSESKII